MQLLETKKVKIGNTIFPVKVTNRAMIEFESLTGTTIDKLQGTEMICKFFYCTAKAGARSEGKPFDYTFDQFLDQIDDFHDDVILNFPAAIAGKNDPDPGKKKSR
ncbi:MAG TPA: hypothetical protein VK179_13830 [Bacteroidales bacterium]|nr:hypothetical protein [Bacteroidales bacterium]